MYYLVVEGIAVFGIFAVAVATDGAICDADVDEPEDVDDGNQQENYLPCGLVHVVLAGDADAEHVEDGNGRYGQIDVDAREHGFVGGLKVDGCDLYCQGQDDGGEEAKQVSLAVHSSL